MASGFRIPLIADVKDWLSGTKKMGESLDDVADALDGLAKESQTNANQMEGDFKSAANSLNQIGDKAKDSSREVDSAMGKASASVKDLANDTEQGTREMGKSFDKVGNDVESLSSDVKAEAKKIEDAFDDAAKGIEDSGKDVKNLSDDVEDVRKDVEKETEKMEKSFKEAFDSAKKSSGDAGKGIGDGVKKGTDEANEGLSEFKDEANSTARESAASFDGSADSIIGSFQEIAANAFAGFGPAGAVAGLAAAAGIGLVVSALQGSAEEALEAKEKIIELADQINEVGGDLSQLDWAQMFRDFGNEIGDSKEWWEPWQDEAVTNIELVKKNADELGISFQDLFQGMSGDSEAGKRALEEINEKIAESEEAYLNLLANGVDPVSAAHITQIDRLKEVREELETNSGVTGEATELEALYKEGLEGSNAELQVQREELAEVNEQLRENRDEKVSAIEADIAFHDTLAKTNKVLQEGTATLDIKTESGRENKSAMIDQANAALDLADAEFEATGNAAAANKVIREQKEAFIQNAIQAGFNEDEVRNLADTMFDVPTYVKTDFTTPGAPESKQRARELTEAAEEAATPRTVPFRVEAPSRWSLQSKINTLFGGVQAPAIPFRVQSSSSQRYVP